MWILIRGKWVANSEKLWFQDVKKKKEEIQLYHLKTDDLTIT